MLRTKVRRRKILNGNVKLAVSETGQGQTLLFFNGVGATQVSWKRIIRQLGGQYRIVTFDFRSHGKSTISHNNSFDGALPVNLVDDPDDVKRRLNTPAVWIGPLILYLIGMGYRLSPDDLATLTIEVNTRREQLLSAYEQLDCTVELVLATKTAGEKGARAERNNALWRAGGEQLTHAYPTLPIHWLDNTHLLPFKEPTKLAEALDDFVRRVRVGDPEDHQMRNEIHNGAREAVDKKKGVSFPRK